MDYAALAAQYGGKSTSTPDYASLAAQYGGQTGTGSAGVDAANAVGTGFNRGLLRLAGLPVDTAANVIDLVKAGAGSLYGAVTGKPPPSVLDLTDRSKIIGSSDYLIKNAQATAPGRFMIDPANPDYEGGYLQAGGGALTGIINPKTIPQAVNQGVTSLLSALGAKGTYDLTGNEALAQLAGMTPLGAQNYGTAGVKAVVRGGEAGRQAMQQRITDLYNAGVTSPTVGIASGNKFVGGVENILQSTPGAIGVMGKARDAAVNALSTTTSSAAAAASPNRGALAAGTAIQSGLRDFKDNFKTTQEGLYNNLDQYIPGQTPTDVTATRNALSSLNADIPGAPQLSKQFKNARIQAIEGAVNSDTAGTPAVPPTMSVVVGPNGQPFVVSPGVPAGPPNGLPFEAVKKARTLVGNEIADNSLMSDVPRSKWNPLYGALSTDMQAAATANGPQAAGAFNRANNYTRAGMDRLDMVAPFANQPAPEQSFKALSATANENTSILQAVKKSLPEGARGSVAGTVIERLGKATNGVQNDSGTVWSPETFLTNWNKMTPSARQEMFSGFPNSDQVMSDVTNVAKAASMMRDSSRMWANPSGTAANLSARAFMGSLGAAAFVNPWAPVAGAGAMLGTNLTARALTSSRVVNALAQKTNISPEMMQAQINALIGSGAEQKK